MFPCVDGVFFQMSEHRERAVYMTGLPASITVQKMEGLLEMEADCEVEDICLMKVNNYTNFIHFYQHYIKHKMLFFAAVPCSWIFRAHPV